jgi:aspartate carbamoyltransferase catalytic subunit
MADFKGRDIVSIGDFTREELEYPFYLTDYFKKKAEAHEQLHLLEGHVLCTLFYEPSTRTRLSFESAMGRLGGTVITVAPAQLVSSAAKGESLEDAATAMGQFADIILLRHPEWGAARRAADIAPVPIINAGDGANEHPIQVFSELYTIQRVRGQIDGLEITFLGDLKHNRCIRSLVMGLSNYEVKLNLVSPEGLEMAPEIKAMFREEQLFETSDLDEVLPTTDVIYMVRVQVERYESKEAAEAFKGSYLFDMSKVRKAKDGLTVMHPQPRVDELATEVDSYAGAIYWRQSRDLVFNRMAILALILGKA